MDEPYSADVESVGEYIEIINEIQEYHGWSPAYFRGESRDFRATRLTASALRRPIDGYQTKMGKYRDMLFSRLTPNESEHFLAFCQHHGFPTNLLDVTVNPLVALYFACVGSPSRDGVVYAFAEKFCDFTKLITRYGEEDILWDVLKSNGPSQMRRLFEDALKAYAGRTYGGKMPCSRFYRVLRGNRYTLRFKYEDGATEERDYPPKSFMDADIAAAKEAALKRLRFRSNREPEREDGTIKSFSCSSDDAVLDYIKICLDKGMWHDEGSSFYTCHLMNDVLPPSIYKPLLSFGRAQAQHSCFIYQWRTAWLRQTQTIAPDCVFTVPAREKPAILKTLDMMAVNRATIFADYDNIAQYALGSL